MNNEEFDVELTTEEAQGGPQGGSKNILALNKIIRWCIYLLVFLMPLWFLPFTNEVLNFNKQVLMVGLLTIALIAWLGELITKDKIRWYKGLPILVFLGFVVIYGLSTIFSLRPYSSLMGLDTHLSRALINIIYFFVFFLLIVNYRNEEKEKRNAEILRFLTIFLASATIAGIIGLLQILKINILPWAFAKLTSFNTIGTVSSLGIFLAVLLPVAFSFLFGIKPSKEKKEKLIATGLKMFLGLLIVLTLILLLLLNYRTLWIITAIGMVVVVGFWLAKRHTLPSQNLGWLAIPVVILAFCLIFLLFRPGALFDLDLPIELGLSHRGGWDITKEVIKRSPILGTGPETFIYNYSLYKPGEINQTIFWNLRFANAPSEIMSLLSEIGILGILAFLTVIGVFLLKAIKGLIGNGRDSGQLIEIKIGLFSGWLALITAWFLYPQSLALVFIFWLFLAFLTAISSKAEDTITLNLKTSGKIALTTSFGFIIVMIAVVGLLYLEGSRFIAESAYKTGIDMVNSEELDAGINKVIRATIANPYEDGYYRNLAQLFVIQISQNLNNQNLTQEDRTNRVQAGISNAINSAIRATALNPKNAANWIVRGSIYRNLMPLASGSGAWAISSYKEALGLEPGNPFIYTEIARTYVGGADLLTTQAQKDAQAQTQIAEYLNKAVESYNQAIELKSNYSPAHFELALVYDRQGKTNEAIAKMENSQKLAPKDIGAAFQLAVLYYKNSQFDKAKAEFARAVTLDENFSNARYFLGLLLDREGNKEAAIDQFEKIAKLNPDNNLVQDILENLKAGKPALGAEAQIPQQPQEIPVEEGRPEELKTQLPSE